MKEYLIAFQHKNALGEWKWAKMIWRGKMTGQMITRIEDDIRDTLGAELVRIMTFSELESDSEGV